MQRIARFFALIVLLLAGCTDGGVEPSGDPAVIGLRPVFAAVHASHQTLPINLIRLTATDQGTGAVLDSIVLAVDPGASDWEVEFPIAITETVQRVVILIELINSGPNGLSVEWSGRTAPITVTPASVSVQDVQVFPGPPENLLVRGVNIRNAPAFLMEGDSIALLADIDAPAGTVVELFWASLSATSASVNGNGVVRALQPGTATVIASAGPASDTITFPVLQRPATLTLSPDRTDLDRLGATVTFTPTVRDTRGVVIPGAAVEWSSDNATVLAHRGNGAFEAVGSGSTTVTAFVTSAPAVRATAPATVQQRATRVVVTPATTLLDARGASVLLTAVVEDASGRPIPGSPIAWTTSAASVATVDAAGRVTAVDNGVAAITATVPATTVSGNAQITVQRVARSIAKAAGDAQTGTAGAPLPVAPSVRVVDANGHNLAGVAVAFAVTQGGGSISAVSATTDASGSASAGWTLGQAAGTNLITATVAGLPPLTFTATATAGTPAGMVIASGNAQTGPVAAPLPITPSVRVIDAFGNPVAGRAVIFATQAGTGGVEHADVTTTADGVAQAGVWTLGPVPGVQTLTASTQGLPSVVFTATAEVGAPASIVLVAGNGQNARVGAAVAVAPAVRVVDALGNGIAGVSVVFAVTSGGGVVAGSPAVTDAGGVARIASWTMGAAPGPNSLSVSSAALTPVLFTATATVGLPASMSIHAGNAQTATVGTAVAVAPAVIVKDALNNPVAGVSVTFTPPTGSGVSSGSPAVTNAAGIATLAGWTLGANVGVDSLVVSSAGLALVIFTANASVGAAATIAIHAGNGQGATVGTAVAVAPAVIVRDALNNPVPGVSVAFTAPAGSGVVAGSPATTNAAGIATVTSWTLGANVGQDSLTTASAGLPPITFTANALVGAAASMSIHAGNAQTATVGTAVPVAPAVIVKDALNNPVAGVSVTFTPPPGSGVVVGSPAITNAAGIATVTIWTLGANVGSDSLTVSSAGLPAVVFTANATVGAAASMSVHAGNAQTATAGTAVPVAPAVIVKDALNNPVAGVSVTFTPPAGSGVVLGSPAVTNAAGIATITSWTLGANVGVDSLTASSAGLAPVVFTASATVGAAALMSISAGNGQSATVGTAVTTDPAVLVTDALNNPVAGVAVTFTPPAGSGVVLGSPAITNAAGIATITSWTLGANVGVDSLTVSSAGLTSVVFTASATVGAAALMSISAGNGQSATVGTTVTTDPAVLVTDALNNPVAGVAVTFTPPAGSGVVVGSPAITNAAGIATITSWTLGANVGTDSLTAASAGLAPVVFTASASVGAAALMSISAGNGQSATVGTAVTTDPAVLVTDALNNPVAGVAVTFTPTAGSGVVVGSPAVTNAAGIATITSWTLGANVGTDSLTAASAGLAPVVFTASATVGAAALMSISAGNGQSATVGTAVTTDPAVLVTDALNNPVAGVAVTFTPPAGSGVVLGSPAITNAAGIATITSWTLGANVGTDSLTAASAGLAPVVFTASATVGAAALMSISAGNGQSATVGTAVTTDPAVLVTDALNNPVAGVAVTFTPPAGSGVVLGSPAITNAAGIATITSWTLGANVGVDSLTASSAGLAPVVFTASATVGAAALMSISAGNGQSATVGTAVTTAPAVLVTDAQLNPVPGVSVTFTPPAGSGVVVGSPAITNAAGIATITSWTLGANVGVDSLTASSAGLTPVVFTASATVGAAALMSISAGNGQSATVGTAVTTAPAVLVTDAQLNPVPGVSVTFTPPAGSGVVVGSPAITNAAGIATITSWTLGANVGVDSLTASSAGLTPVVFTASATVGAAALMSISAGNGQSATVGTAVTTAPAVLVTDAQLNPVPGVSVTFTPPAGSGVVVGSPAITNAAGIATITSWTLGANVGVDSLTASSAGLTPVVFTASATVGAAALMSISAGNGQSATVGTAVTTDPAVLVTDALNNPVAGVAVTFTPTAGSGVVVGSPAVTNAAGIATITSWTLGANVGTDSLTAASAGLAPVVFTASATVGAAALMSISAGNGQSAVVGNAVAIDPAVLVTDAQLNPVPGISVTFTPPAGSGVVVGSPAVTNAAGIATITSWTLGANVGTDSLTVSSAGLTPVVFTANAAVGAAASMSINVGNGQTAVVGNAVAVAPSVIVKDALLNPVPGVSVTFTPMAGSGVVVGSPAVTNAAGIATITSWTLGANVGTDSLTVSSAGLTPVVFTANAAVGAAASMSINVGNGQTAVVGNAVAVAPSVIVKDALLNPVPGVSVTFTPMAGSGVVVGSPAVTNAAGIATITSWTLGANVGTDSLTVSSAGLTPVVFTANAAVGAAASMSINVGNGQTAVVGNAVAVAPSVIVKDALLNPVPGVSVAFTPTAGSGVVVGSPAVTNAAGIATITSWTLGANVGTDSLTVSSAGLTSVVFTASATVGAAASMSINVGNGQTAVVGNAVAVAPSVIVKDALLNPVPGVSVTFTPPAGSGVVVGSPAITNAAGIAAITSWTLGANVGTDSLTVSSAGLTSVVFTASATVGAAASMSINVGNGQTAVVGNAVAVAPSVIVKDALLNPVPGVSVTFTPPAGSGVVVGSPAITNAAGIATITSWTLGANVGTDSLTAASAGLAPVVFTASATVGAAALMSISAGNGQNATVGTAVTTAPAVLVTDAQLNPVPGVSVTFTPPAGSGVVVGSPAITNAAGIATITNWTLGPNVGTDSLTVSSAGLMPVTFVATATVGAAASVLIHEGNAQTATVGTAVATDPAVIVKDANNNPVPNVSVAFLVTAGGGVASGTPALTDASGIARLASWTMGATAGADSMTATVAGLPVVTFTATAVAGPAATLNIVPASNNQTTTVGTAVPIDPSVIVRDAFMNPVAGVTVNFATTTPGSAVSPASVVSNASGVATVTSWTVRGIPGNNTLTASSIGLTSVTFNATSTVGVPITMTRHAGNAQTASVGTAVTNAPAVVIADALGNGVPGLVVTFAVSPGSGVVTGSPVVTDSLGIARSTSWTLGTVPGANSLVANSVVGLLSTTFSATATVGAPAVMSVHDGAAQTATVNAAVTTPPAVRVTDSFGNFVPGVSVTFTANAGNGTVVGSPATTDAAGIARVTSWTLGTVAGADSLVVTSAGVTSVTVHATAITGPAAILAVHDGNGQSATVGTAVTVAPAVRVTDAHGNAIAGDTVTFSVTGGGGSASGLAIFTDANGVARVPAWVLGNAAGPNQLTASAAPLTSVVFNATGTAGAANAMSLFDNNSQVGAVGSLLGIPGVLVVDVHGNPVAGVPVTFAVGIGGGTVSGAATTTNVAGIARPATWHLGTVAGPNTLTATSTVPPVVTFSATGVPGNAARVQFSVEPPDTTNALTNFAAAVQIVDSYGNIRTNDSTSVITLSIVPMTGTTGAVLSASGGLSRNVIGGTRSFTDLQLDLPGGGYRLLASALAVTADSSASVSVAAVANNWIDPAGGAWDDGANWSLGVAPDANQVAVIDLAGSYAVTVSGARAARALRISPASGDVTLSVAAGSSLSTSGGSIEINANGTLDVSGAILNSAHPIENYGNLRFTAAQVDKHISNFGAMHVDDGVTQLTSVQNELAGTFSLGSGSGTAVAEVALNVVNSGMIRMGGELATMLDVTGTLSNAATGTVRTHGPSGHQIVGNITNAGILQIETGTTIQNQFKTLDLSGGRLQIEPVTTLTVDSGTVVIDANTDLTGTGTISYASSVVIDITGAFTLTTGMPSWEFPGIVTVDAPAGFTNETTLSLSGDEFSSGLFTNKGTLHVSTWSPSTLADGLVNVLGGLVRLDAADENTELYVVDGNVLNSGTIEFDGYSGVGFLRLNTPMETTTSGVIHSTGQGGHHITAVNFLNDGTLSADAGITVNLINGTLDSRNGTIHAGSSSTIALDDGTIEIGGGTTMTGDGMLQFTSTTALNIAAQPAVDASLTWVGHGRMVINAALPYTNNHTILLSGDSITGDIVNSGTLRISDGTTAVVGNVENLVSATIEIAAGASAAKLLITGSLDNLEDVAMQGGTVAGILEVRGGFRNDGSVLAMPGAHGHRIIADITNNGSIGGDSDIDLEIYDQFIDNYGTLYMYDADIRITGTAAQSVFNNGSIEGIPAHKLTVTGAALLNELYGVIEGIGTVDVQLAESFTSAGTIKPGATIGKMTVMGNLTNTGTVIIDIDGLVAETQHDVLAVTGTLAHTGTTHVVRNEGFTPALGVLFQVMTSAVLSPIGAATLSGNTIWGVAAPTGLGFLFTDRRILLVSLVPS